MHNSSPEHTFQIELDINTVCVYDYALTCALPTDDTFTAVIYNA